LSAGYAANAADGLKGKLRLAQAMSASAAQAVRAGAGGITTGGGYQDALVEDLGGLFNSLTQLQLVRPKMFSSPATAAKTVQIYADQAIQAADTFSVSVGNGTSDADLNGDVTALGALLRVENQMSLQRASLFVALNSSPPALTPAQLTGLLQAQQQQVADQAEFTAAASQAELQVYNRAVSGSAAVRVRAQEALALTNAFSDQPLTALNNVSSTKLTASGWYSASTLTIQDTRKVAGQLAAGIATRAAKLRSQATTGLLFGSLLTVALLGLVLLVSTLVARSTVSWPAGSRASNGNAAVAQVVKSTPGAIGYVDYATAKAAGLTFASVENRDGIFMAPSPTSAASAASQVKLNPDLTFSAVWAGGGGSYPITYQSYDLVYATQPNAEDVRMLQTYIGYLLGAGQELLPQLGYAPLPAGIDQGPLAGLEPRFAAGPERRCLARVRRLVLRLAI
jgi:hypothetical protein